MKLEGIHHVTAITADAQRNVDFYAGVLGLRLVKKSVNQDHTSVYHLFYADEPGDPGSDITFFEYPGAPRGRAGAGMVHRIVWRVSGPEALEFWERRLADAGYRLDARREDRFALRTSRASSTSSLVVQTDRRAADRPAPGDPVRAGAPGLSCRPRLHARPAREPRAARGQLGFQPQDEGGYEVRGDRRGGLYLYDPPRPSARCREPDSPPRRLGRPARGQGGVAARP